MEYMLLGLMSLCVVSTVVGPTFPGGGALLVIGGMVLGAVILFAPPLPAALTVAIATSKRRRGHQRRSGKSPSCLLFAFVLVAGPAVAAQPEPFTFAGLSGDTTIAELKQRYPQSVVVGQLVYVSARESHDSISTIGMSSTGARRNLTVTFEQRQPSGSPTYPACEKLLSTLTARYGPPNVIEAQEERARNRRFEWKTSTESLTLGCFQLPSQPLYAERLTIASDR
jgi:hypothetical protein